MITIYHNKSCSKSCHALEQLKQNGEQFEIIEYLEDIPSIDDLKTIVKKLQCKPHDLIRINEPIYLQKFIGKNLTDEEWIAAMHENPILIQRPIVINGDKAVIARSVELTKDINGVFTFRE
jgi:arsenate reductase